MTTTDNRTPDQIEAQRQADANAGPEKASTSSEPKAAKPAAEPTKTEQK